MHAVFERMAFSIAFTTIAEENGLTETEKGFAMASYYFGFTVSQVKDKKTLSAFYHVLVTASVYAYVRYKYERGRMPHAVVAGGGESFVFRLSFNRH